MRTTEGQVAVPYREVTGRHGRVYRIGESDVDLMGRARVWMAVLPWAGMAAVALAGCAFAVAGEALHGARPWSDGRLLWPLGVWVSCQGAVALSTGRLRASGGLPARVALPLGAAATMVAGLLLVCVPDAAPARLGFAVFGGAGAGIVHATCVTTSGRWYPDRRGAPTALVSGGFPYGLVPPAFLLSPRVEVHGHATVPAVLGAAGCLATASIGRLFEEPPRNWWPAGVDPLRPGGATAVRPRTARNPPAVRQFGPGEAARTPVLWLLWCCLLCAGGVGVLGLAFEVPFGRSAGFGGGVVSAALFAGAVVNGVGLGAVGLLSDRYGRRTTLVVVCVAISTAQFGVLLSGRLGSQPFFLVCVLLSGLTGAAVLPLLASMTADCFGENDLAAHHGLVHSATAAAGPAVAALGAGPLGARDFHGAFVLAGSLELASSVLALFLTAPGRPKVRRVVPNPQPLGEEMA
ncbi:MFS transporter [Streptomyces griseoviridis]|uniref:MFS transporter n=1 Tax=Streptomyces griseoviridis TaxID=45398 RepID=UPI00344BB672